MYITGLVHSGDGNNIVRPFLRDHDAVKAAWDALVKAQTQKTPTAENAEGVFFNGTVSMGEDTAGGSHTTLEFPLPGGDVQRVNPGDSTGASPSSFDPVSHLQYEYGSLPEGENAAREDSLPTSTNGKDRASLTARTAKGAWVTPDGLVDLLDKETVGGRFSYIPIKNSKTVLAAYHALGD